MAGWQRSGGGWHSAEPWQQQYRTRTDPDASRDAPWDEYGWGEYSWHDHSWAHEGWTTKNWEAANWGDNASDAWGPADSASTLSAGSGAHVPEQYPWTADRSDVPQEGADGINAGTSSERGEQVGASTANKTPAICPEGRSEDEPEQTNETEEEVLRRLHTDAMLRFHLKKSSPESEDGEMGEKDGLVAADDSVDPEIGDFDPATGGVHCKVCDRPLNSKAQFQDHLKGKKHRKNFDKKQAAASQALSAVSPLLTVRTVTCTSDANSAVHLWGVYVPAASYQ